MVREIWYAACVSRRQAPSGGSDVERSRTTCSVATSPYRGVNERSCYGVPSLPREGYGGGTRMNYAQQRSPGRQAFGVAVVVLLHVVVGYALIMGLGKQIVEVIKQPLETKIIEDVKPPPPPVAVAVVAPPPAPAVVRPTAPPPPAIPDHDAGEHPISAPPFVYPKRMQDAGREGKVELECDVDIDGKTSNCTVINTVGGAAFSDAALDWVSKAKYSPRIEHGVPVKAVHHKLVVNFKLND